MWQTVQGHEQNKKFLERIIIEGKRTPALLFYGVPGIGKKKLALEFAKTFLCYQTDINFEQSCSAKEAVGTLSCETSSECRCNSCRAFAGQNHPDFILVTQQQAGKDIVLEQIKEIARQAAFAPRLSTHKVCIIDAADFMNPAAANSLLKLLEEPPAYWLFILLAETTDKLLPTILSRVIKLRFAPLPEAVVVQELRAKYVHLTALSAQTIARLSGGSLGMAFRLADDESLKWRDFGILLLEQLPTKLPLQLVGSLEWLDKITNQEGLLFTELLLYLIRDGLFVREGLQSELLNLDIATRLEVCFTSWSERELQSLIPIVQNSYQGLVDKTGTKAVLETMILNMNSIRKGDLICQ